MTDIVTIVQTGSTPQEVNFEEGMTVAEALEASGLSAGEGVEVRLNGAANDDLEAVLSAGDTILLVSSIRGA